MRHYSHSNPALLNMTGGALSEHTYNRWDSFLKKLLLRFQIQESSFLVVTAVAVGVLGSWASIGFERAIHYGSEAIAELESFLDCQGPAYRWLFPLAPALGGLIVGLMYKLNPRARGNDIPHVMLSVAKHGSLIRFRDTLLKTAASIITIASGGSAGPEGPMVVIGSGIGSRVGRSLNFSSNRLAILVACGAAAALSAIFNAPIAGVMFALEEILGSFSVATLAPVVISSVVSSAITRATLGDHPAFAVPHYEIVSQWHLVHYSLLGVFCALLSVVFIKMLYGTETVFSRMRRIPAVLRPALGGLIVGIIGLKLPGVLGIGYNGIKAALFGQLGLELMIALLAVKLLSTSISLGSGGSGGVFAPLLFTGAMAGGIFGWLFDTHLSLSGGSAGIEMGAYALVGASAMLAGCGHAPLTAIMMVFELTNDYRLILPIMIASVVSLLVSRRLNRDSIYTTRLTRMGEKVYHGADLSTLNRITVDQVYNRQPDLVTEEMDLTKILSLLKSSRYNDLPVTDRAGRFLGMISFQDLRTTLMESDLAPLILARDVLREDIPAVHPEDTLLHALNRFGIHDLDHLPVVDSADSGRLLGLLSRSDVMTRYNKELLLNTE